MFLKNLSISKKLASGFGLIALINIIFAWFLHVEHKEIQNQLVNFTEDTFPAYESVDEIEANLSYWRRTQFASLLTDDSAEVTRRLNQSRQLQQKIDIALKKYGEDVWPGEEERLFNQLMTRWNNYSQTMVKFNQALAEKNSSQAHQLLDQSLAEFQTIESQIKQLSTILKQAMDGNKDYIISAVARINTSSSVINGLIIAFMVIITYFLTRIICQPLKLVVDQSNAIAKGDLSKALNRSAIGNDELGELADASIAMQNNLRQLIEETISAVTQLGSSVEEMTQISSLSAQGMQEQQDQITQVATAMSEMKAAVADVADNTENTAQEIDMTNRSVQDGAKDNKQMVSAIAQVAEVITQTGQTVAELEQQSNQINMIVDVIRGIADQTNLLALNAAIEAARAGESGRGFAVVADEVRTLAARTQDSTGEITSIIEKLQAMAKEAKEGTDRSCNSIEHCVEQGNHSQQLMHSIEQSIAQVADMGAQIASACSQQDSVADELTRNIENIHLASQEVAEGANQTAQACNELAQLSISLQNAMTRFKLQ
ncbi:HAMP domain-containing protein [Vibrio sp. V27_P1S3P104]|uniref:methyl-accepting chemotaxis protein n=1 Tax=unclassified Vibrio TaxID=2614977 RepID=UPI001373556A|nr:MULTISPECIES: methyl-accepting chemotaxis protein [unclassified Vibrio]NAW67815.1 HAMP domain-containing protein [Vibrio sp. V28_P6S34P95]NAX03660.1 HAMP domain-containing protein [Vibrio sp. V30_P3S12P165]NAX33598.1 HAMP domain-containing protein [Vibrio sp. V29_P1S30P107]NAX35911.1 HAMP domain-containing protein [Vibrio sp. V27_P1S3P104]